MADTNFQPIFDYIDNTKKEILEQTASKADIERVFSAVGAFDAQAKDHDGKITLMQNKTENLEKWVIVAAEKTEILYNL